MIVVFRDHDKNAIRTITEGDDLDLLEQFEGLVYAVFCHYDQDDVFERIERAAKCAAKDHD